MLKRNALLLVAGTAVFALNASSASAQARPRSTRRIPVSKEAPGEVAPPRVDTVTVYKTDTLRMQGRVDTLRLTNTVTRTDTVIQQVQIQPHFVGGVYLGLAGGVGLPYGAIRTVNEPGELAQLQVGWQGLNNPIGLRLDGTWNRFARNPSYGGFLGDRPTVLGLNGDVRLDLPIFNHTLGSSVRMKPYLVGGGSYVRYSNLRMKYDRDDGKQVTGGVGPCGCGVIAVDGGGSTTANSDSHGDWGFNFGGGLGFHSGRKEIFIESRGIRFNHGSNSSASNVNVFHSSYQVPIVFGVNFF